MKEGEVKYKVLIVDDDSAVRAMYVPYFKAKGHETIAASNGKEAIEILTKQPIDIIILDLAMPEMRGEEVMRAMSNHPKWKNIPVVVDTALASDSEQAERIKKEFQGKLRFEFFERPTNLDQLNAAIGRVLIL